MEAESWFVARFSLGIRGVSLELDLEEAQGRIST